MKPQLKEESRGQKFVDSTQKTPHAWKNKVCRINRYATVEFSMREVRNTVDSICHGISLES